MNLKQLFFCGLIMVQPPVVNAMICYEHEGLLGDRDALSCFYTDEDEQSVEETNSDAEAYQAAMDVLVLLRKWHFGGSFTSVFSDQHIMDQICQEDVVISFGSLSRFLKCCDASDEGKAFLVILAQFVNGIEHYCASGFGGPGAGTRPFDSAALFAGNRLVSGGLCEKVQLFLRTSFPEKQWSYLTHGFLTAQLAAMIIPVPYAEQRRYNYRKFLENLDVSVGLLEFIFLIKLRMICALEKQRTAVLQEDDAENKQTPRGAPGFPLANVLSVYASSALERSVRVVDSIDDDNDHH